MRTTSLFPDQGFSMPFSFYSLIPPTCCCVAMSKKNAKSFTVFRLKAELFLERLEGDWDRASLKKAWLYRDAWSVHAACGGFNAIIEQLKQSVPQKDFREALPGLVEQFRLGILDGDIVTFLETTVPPISLEQVPFIRSSSGPGWD